MVLLDSTAPKPGPAQSTSTDPYNVIGRVAALSAASAHLGAGRLLNPFSYTSLPPRSRDEARAKSSTASSIASSIEEYGVANTSMQQASALTSLNGKPLIVLTADEGADDQWQSKQDHMFLRTRPQISAELASSASIRGLVRRNATVSRRAPELQLTTRLSPSTLIVFSGSGLGAGGFTTEPSVIEYLLP